MKEYEVVREIFNSCSGNQMRDVFMEEVQLTDPEDYVRARHKDADLSLIRSTTGDGSLIIDVDSCGLRQRYTFTEIE